MGDDRLRAKIDPIRSRYPYCIVWGSLPVLTWLCPWIGHVGICDSQGRVHDFQGPYYIGVDRFMSGKVLMYLEFPEMEGWDEGVDRSDQEFVKTMHNICCNNCHHHAAFALSYIMNRPVSMWALWWQIMTQAKYPDIHSLIYRYIGLFLVLLVVFVVSFV